MDSFSSKLRNLRTDNKWTQEVLADKVGCNVLEIKRYERGSVYPNMHTLALLSVIFNVPSDYLLGLSDIDGNRYNQQAHISQINKTLNNKPIEDEMYYWVDFCPTDLNGAIEWNAQTMWVGFTEDKEYELRVLRPMKANNAIERCTEAYGRPWIVNDANDLLLATQFGGHSIIRASVVESDFPRLLEPIKVKRDNPTYVFE